VTSRARSGTSAPCRPTRWRTRGGGAGARRADAPVAPDGGNGVGPVSRIPYPGPGTVRGWPRGFRGTGPAPVDPAAYPEREGRLTRVRETSLRAALRETPPRDTNGVRDIIPRRSGVGYTRGGAVRPMHRPGFGYIRPKPLPRQAGRAAREALMRKYGRLVRDAPPDGTTVLPGAVHPGWRSRRAHGRVHQSDRPAVRSATGRRRLDPHGAPGPGTVRLAMAGGGRTGAVTVPRPLRRPERARPGGRVIHVLPDNARQHHARGARALSRSGPAAVSGRVCRRPTRPA